jgi:TP901 family phage tail tape measure protein
MASGGVSFLFSAGLQFDKAQMDAEMAKLQQTVGKSAPINIQTSMGNKIDTGNAQQILTSIQQQATAIDSVIVKQKTLKDAGENTYRALTQMTVKWRDANGNVLTTVKQIQNETTKMKGLKTIQTDTGELKIGAQVKEVTKAYSDREKLFDQMSKKATEWSTRAENMGEKEKSAIQGSAQSLKEKVQTYKELVKVGDLAGAGKLAKEIELENIALDKNIALSKRAAVGVRSWADNIKNAIMQTVSYTMSIGTIRAAQQLLNESIMFTIELNKEMTKIQVLQAEGAQTPDEIRALAMQYNGLAQQMGTTTLEIAKGSVEWLRQGKTIQETSTLMKSSTMLAKLGALGSAEATEYLTSTINSYGMAASDATAIVDKLVAVDNKSATSTGELATALRYSAASAKEAGVSLEQLISYIGVVSSTTRQNAESIGQGFKTLLTRMEDIKAGKIDDDGLGINNVESALARVNVKLRDSRTEFRDMGSVLEELAGKWSTLNDIEQAN